MYFPPEDKHMKTHVISQRACMQRFTCNQLHIRICHPLSFQVGTELLGIQGVTECSVADFFSIRRSAVAIRQKLAVAKKQALLFILRFFPPLILECKVYIELTPRECNVSCDTYW